LIAPDADTTRLLLACPDRPGLIATASGFLADAGLNIVDVDQHSTAAAEMEFGFSESGRRKRVAVMVSREDHCLSDLLWRWRNGHLGGEIVTVISNHEDLRGEVEAVGLPFEHLPVARENKVEAEQQALDVIGQVDLLVLARYMQILSPAFLTELDAPAINIHHSFLPAFVGADPYARAHERGVKLIGATAHYVTAELDAGPIIDQDVVRVGHEDEVPDLVRIGRDVERIVLARAVTAHLQDRVLIDGERTVVF
jgi:formyltetrahydrofolate deformylase